MVAIAIGALILSSCSKSTTSEQTTGTPGDPSVSATDVSQADIMDIDTPIVNYPGVEHLHFSYGPIDVLPGQNNIEISGKKVPKPDVDGYIVGIRPNLRLPRRHGARRRRDPPAPRRVAQRVGQGLDRGAARALLRRR